MRPIRVLVDTLADEGLLNAQMGNGREIIRRLDPAQFHVTTFFLGKPDPTIVARENTRLIQLPERRKTVRIFAEFMRGAHHVLFYVKSAPASRWYLSFRSKWRDRRVAIGTIESQCNLKDELDVAPEAVRLWEQTVLRCDRLYSNSAYVQKSLKQEYGLESGIIPTGADTNFFTPAPHRQVNARPVVLFVGSLRRRKHPEFLLTAAACFPQVDFRIVGAGPMEPELQARIDREGLKNVVLPGALGAERLRQEYRQADIFLFPSTFEGSPKVIVEAAACGLPVIVRDSYAPETVVHGVTGYQAKSEQEMLSFLHGLVSQPDLRVRMGRAGREHCTMFDWDVIARQWEQAFIDAASPCRLGRAS